jgi:hypothetical protein
LPSWRSGPEIRLGLKEDEQVVLVWRPDTRLIVIQPHQRVEIAYVLVENLHAARKLRRAGLLSRLVPHKRAKKART